METHCPWRVWRTSYTLWSMMSMSLYLLHSLHSAGSDLLLCWFQLLDFEARSGEQVPLLLKMKRSQLALSKAVESGDTDLGNCVVPRHHLSVTLTTSLMVSCGFSLHGGDVSEERDEPRRFLHDTEKPAGRPQSLQTGSLHHHFI